MPHVLVAAQFYVISFYPNQSSINIVDYVCQHDMTANKIKLIIVTFVGTLDFILSVWERTFS